MSNFNNNAEAGQSSTTTAKTAQHACVACRRQKRRCTKELPKCRLCTRLRKTCDYTDTVVSTTSDELSALRSRVEELESRLTQASSESADGGDNDDDVDAGAGGAGGSGGDGNHGWEMGQPLWHSTDRVAGMNRNAGGGGGSGRWHRRRHRDISTAEFPVVFFLDRELTAHARPLPPKPGVTVPEEVLLILGVKDEILHVASLYFDTVHMWLPCISKKRMKFALESPDFELRSDTAALFLSMKLITGFSFDETGNAQSDLYHLVKRYIFDVEWEGLLSIPLIQSHVLLATYEMGHGIYPAAYLSAAHCARLGQAYGIDNRKSAPQMGRKPGAWAEHEEHKRVWWAIILLDRFVNMGIGGHALATEDPKQKDVLPAHCQRWDNGELSTAEPVYVFTPTNVKTGPFTRTCQAVNLIGRYIRHRNDTDLDAAARFEEAIQLQRTILAFSRLLPDEVAENPLQCCTAMALTLGVLLQMYDAYSCTETNHQLYSFESTEMQTIAIAGARSTADDVLRLTNILETVMTTNFRAISPLTIDCIYQAASTFAWLVHEVGSTDLIQAYKVLQNLLLRMSKRWGLASQYLKVMDLAKAQLYNNDPLL